MDTPLEKFPDFIATPVVPPFATGKATRPSLQSAGSTFRSVGRRSRRTSSLGSDIRGDTSAPAVSTISPRPVYISPAGSPRSEKPPHRGSKRRKARSLLRRWKNLSFKHTWVNPLILMLLGFLCYAVYPSSKNPLHSAIFLSYALPSDDPSIPSHATPEERATRVYYGKGRKDLAFVSFYIVVLSFTREFLMQRLIRPWAIRCGIKSRAKQSRFMEQVYTAIYFSIFGPLGLYVMSRTPVWYFDVDAMFASHPNLSHEAVFKTYYLLQASYWAQQAIVLCLQLEKPRKDFKELVAHHVITLFLIGLSYRFHFTYVGLAVYITHDISDLFLATSKTLNYLSHRATPYFFTLFIGVWFYTRHYINLCILYSLTTPSFTNGEFVLDWAAEQFKCRLSQYVTFGLLGVLQAINIFWFALILNILIRILVTGEERDTRSDDEYEEDEEVEEEIVIIQDGKRLARCSEAACEKATGIVRTGEKLCQRRISEEDCVGEPIDEKQALMVKMREKETEMDRCANGAPKEQPALRAFGLD